MADYQRAGEMEILTLEIIIQPIWYSFTVGIAEMYGNWLRYYYKKSANRHWEKIKDRANEETNEIEYEGTGQEKDAQNRQNWFEKVISKISFNLTFLKAKSCPN